MFNVDNGYSLADIAAATNGGDFNNGSAWWIIILFLFCFMGGGNNFFGRNTDLNQYATAASQQEILFGQQFQGLSSAINKVGDGLSSLGYSQLQQMCNNTSTITGNIVNEGRAIQSQLADCCCSNKEATAQVRYDMANFASAIQANDTANTQKILDAISQDKIASLQAQVTELKTQNMFCGIPRISNYAYGVYPYAANPCCPCGSYVG